MLQQRVDERTTALNEELERRRQAESEVRGSNEILELVNELRESFIQDSDPFSVSESCLQKLLKLTGSEFGFLGDLEEDDSGKPYLLMQAITHLSWDAESEKLYSVLQSNEFKFTTLDNLIGEVVKTNTPVISNSPAEDERGAGLPHGHPAIANFLGIPLMYGDKMRGELGLANRPEGFDESLLRRIKPVTDVLANLIHARREREARKRAEQELKTQATTDPLTGVFNRRRFLEDMDRQIAIANRYGQSVSIGMIDIDFFKEVNDTRGHDVGDEVLKELAELVQSVKRETDSFCRWGGEEFLLLMSGTIPKDGFAMGERIRSMAESRPFAEDCKITVSLGVTAYRPGESADSFVKRADEALYAAKTGGRNRVELRE